MTDKEYREQKHRILALSKKWLTPLGLQWWNVRIVYSRAGLEQPKDENRCLVAQTSVDWHYLLATITFDMTQISEQPDSDLEGFFVHECGHILINEMRMWADEKMEPEKHSEAMKHEERVVTMLTKSLLWTRKAGYEDAKASKRKRK